MTRDQLGIYSDSDHAGDKPHTMKSHTGSMILLNDTPIQWVSKKQIDSTAYSSAMAEIYYALSEPVRVARSVAWRLEELNVIVQYPGQQAEQDISRRYMCQVKTARSG